MRSMAYACTLLVILGACRGGSAEPPSDRPLSSTRTTGAGAQLVLLDSVQLVETDSSFIGSASGLAVDANGQIFVADAFSARVLEFTREGRFVRAYGRKGDGPGELRKPIAIVLLGDSLIAVSNTGLNSPVVFDRRTGRWVSTGSVSGYIKSGQLVGDSLWFGVLSQKRATSLAIWSLAADSMRYFGPVPAEYKSSARLGAIMSQAPFTVWSDTAAIGFAGVNQLFVIDRAGSVIDTINPPVAHRRGVPANLVEEYAKGEGLEHYTQLASILMQVGRMGNGRLVIVHHDVKQRGDLFSATGYVSLISADRQSACVDAVMALSLDAKPMTALAGDQVVSFEQAVGGGSSASWVKTYRIDDSSCDWVPAA